VNNEFGISEIKTVSEREMSVRPSERKVSKAVFLDDDPLDFEELGIIEVDDEEWNQYDDLGKVPILKGRMKNVSSPAGVQGRVWSGKRRNLKLMPRESSSPKSVEGKAFEDNLKLLRPHNPLFRPLTPPIGSRDH